MDRPAQAGLNGGWAHGPCEAWAFGAALAEGDDRGQRMALLVVDNSVELALRTYLGLHPRQRGGKKTIDAVPTGSDHVAAGTPPQAVIPPEAFDLAERADEWIMDAAVSWDDETREVMSDARYWCFQHGGPDDAEEAIAELQQIRNQLVLALM